MQLCHFLCHQKDEENICNLGEAEEDGGSARSSTCSLNGRSTRGNGSQIKKQKKNSFVT
jgi:hypothetical protein